MDTKEKSYRLVEFSKKLRYRQDVVFSDEGNLDTLDGFQDTYQVSYNQSKPYGLWFSHGRSWVGYLDDSSIWGNKRLGQISHVYRIYLSKSVLKINTDKEFKEFENRFAIPSKRGVFWDKVANRYDGVSIQYFENKSEWYRGWDLSSGCVWNHKGIRDIKLLKSWEVEWAEK